MNEAEEFIPRRTEWIYRFDARWLMHCDLPLAVSYNKSRPEGYRWELWKSMDFGAPEIDDYLLGFYPTCEMAMDAIEGWMVMFFSRPTIIAPPPTRMEQLGRLLRNTIDRIKY